MLEVILCKRKSNDEKENDLYYTSIFSGATLSLEIPILMTCHNKNELKNSAIMFDFRRVGELTNCI
jgi:hypothetical protein